MEKIIFISALVLSQAISIFSQGISYNDPLPLTSGINEISHTEKSMYYSFTPTKDCFIKASTCDLNTDNNNPRFFIPYLYGSKIDYVESSCNDGIGKTIIFNANVGVEYIIKFYSFSTPISYNITISEIDFKQGDIQENPLSASDENTTHFNYTEKWYSYTATKTGYIQLDTAILSDVIPNTMIQDDLLFECEAGVEYTFMVSGNLDSTITWKLEEQEYDENDKLSTAPELILNTSISVNHNLNTQYYKIVPQEDISVKINTCNQENNPTSTILYLGNRVIDYNANCNNYYPMYKGQSYWIRFYAPVSTQYNLFIETKPFFDGFTCSSAIPAQKGINIKPETFLESELWYTYTMSDDGTLDIITPQNTPIQSNEYNSNDPCIAVNYKDYSVSRIYKAKEKIKIQFLSAESIDTFYIQERTADDGEFYQNAIPVAENEQITTVFTNTSSIYHSYIPESNGVIEIMLPENGTLNLFKQNGKSTQIVTPISDSSYIVSGNTTYYFQISTKNHESVNWSFIHKIINEDVFNYFSTAIYDPLNDESLHGESNWVLGDIASDDSESDPNNIAALHKFMLFTFDECNPYLFYYWTSNFDGINRCNLTIDSLAQLDLSSMQNKRDQLYGEAHFLRAHYYFNLTKAFGDLPIILEPFMSLPHYIKSNSAYTYGYFFDHRNLYKRLPQSEVWKQIESDLEIASSLLPLKSEYDSLQNWRVSKGTAQAMLVKAFIFQKKWNDAFIMAKNVIESDEYALMEQYKDVFSYYHENNKEVIFTVHCVASDDYFGTGSINPIDQSFSYVRDTTGNVISYYINYGINNPTQNYVDEFEPGDTRLEMVGKDGDSVYLFNEYGIDSAWFYFDFSKTPYKYYTRKYEMPSIVTEPNPQNSGLDIIQMRYADLLLLTAEAAYHLGKEDTARLYINQVRARARANNAVLPDVTVSGADLLASIKHERRVELGMEGHRFYDLQRWGDLEQTYKNLTELQGMPIQFTPGKHELFPIPCYEIQYSNSSYYQNPGYEFYEVIKERSIVPSKMINMDTVNMPLVFDISDIFSVKGLTEANINKSVSTLFYEDDEFQFSYNNIPHQISAFVFEDELYIYVDKSFSGSFEIRLSGIYSSSSAVDTLTIISESNTGMQQLQRSIIAYPNPVENFFIIESEYNINSIIIVDINGKLIDRFEGIETKTREIKTNNYSPGVYFVIIKGEDKITDMIKIIKI